MSPTGDTWHNMPVFMAGLDEIRPRVRQIKKRKSFFVSLKRSIEADGVKNPLVIIRTTNKAMLDFYGPDRTTLHPLPDTDGEYWMIIVGNQRYWLMRQLGILKAKVIISDNVISARDLQGAMREGFEHIYP